MAKQIIITEDQLQIIVRHEVTELLTKGDFVKQLTKQLLLGVEKEEQKKQLLTEKK